MQTKPPSDEAAFEDETMPARNSASSAQTSSAHSSTGSMSIRVRLPDAPTPEPEETPPAPVLMPNREGAGLPMDSPVRRITFGDFVPAQTPAAPVLRAAEPGTPTPRPGGRKMLRDGAESLAVREDKQDGADKQVAVGDAEPTPVQPPMNGNHTSEPAPVQHPMNRQRHASHNPALLTVEEDVPTRGAFGWQTDSIRERRISGDIRLDPDYNATVIRRPRRQHGRIPWNENHGNSFSGSWEGPYSVGPPQHPGGEVFWQPQHEAHYQPFNGGPPPPFNGAPHPQFHGVPPQFNGAPPQFNGAPPPQFNGGFLLPQSGISPPLSSQPPNGSSPPPNSAFPQPSNDTEQQPSEAGSSKLKPKKKFKNKKKSKSGLSSHTNPRSTTPLPPASNGDATHEATPQTIPGPSNSTNGNTKENGHTKENGDTKENGEAPARPTTPVYTSTVPDDDFYNATPPKKKKGKGKAPAPPGPDEAPDPA